jgi:hypothetical protein
MTTTGARPTGARPTACAGAPTTSTTALRERKSDR